MARSDPVAALLEYDAVRFARRLLERFERTRGVSRARYHDGIVGLWSAAIVARIEQIIIVAVAHRPRAFHQHGESLLHHVWPHELLWGATRRKGHSVGA